VFVPHNTGGLVAVPVTENVSVKQRVAYDDAIKGDMDATPFRRMTVLIVNVLGPVMTKVLKSSLNFRFKRRN